MQPLDSRSAVEVEYGNSQDKHGKTVSSSTRKRTTWQRVEFYFYAAIAASVVVYIAIRMDVGWLDIWQGGGMLSAATKMKEGAVAVRTCRNISNDSIQRENEEAYKRMLQRRRQAFGDRLPLNERQAYFYYTPTYSCPSEERVGDIMDGGKWICNPTSLNSSSIVYSVGSNADVSFEEQLHAICNGCEIHSFDMTILPSRMAPIEKAQAAGVLTFHPYGLGVPGTNIQGVKPLKEIMDDLGHTYIDIFKIDCEKCEWDFFEDLMRSVTRARVIFGQILVELHPFFNERTNKFMKDLEEKGYRIFHYETNAIWRAGIEVSFIHESQVN